MFSCIFVKNPYFSQKTRFSEMYGVVFLIKRVLISVRLAVLEQVVTRLLAAGKTHILVQKSNFLPKICSTFQTNLLAPIGSQLYM